VVIRDPLDMEAVVIRDPLDMELFLSSGKTEEKVYFKMS
jgi:hypothetical protein